MTPLEVEVTEAARSFETMTLEGLREEWSRRYGACPTLRSADLLRRLLAWRIQAEALGGLEARLVRQLIKLAKAGPERRQGVETGVRLAREWQGRMHEVEVVDGGYLYAGQRHRSLSVIARQITGSRWNGPRFFGLREERRAS